MTHKVRNKCGDIASSFTVHISCGGYGQVSGLSPTTYYSQLLVMLSTLQSINSRSDPTKTLSVLQHGTSKFDYMMKKQAKVLKY